MKIELLHPSIHSPLEASLDPLFANAGRVDVASAFVTGPGVRTFLRLVPNEILRNQSRIVASIRWPTDLDSLSGLAERIPGRVYLYRGMTLPEESNQDRPLMHSKVVYVEHGQSENVDILVGSHNWTGQALHGNNVEASIRIQCLITESIAQDVRNHLEQCFQNSEQFDPHKLADYKAIQLELHGSPTRPWGEEIGFVKESIVVIHAEEENDGAVAGKNHLELYIPIWDDLDDSLFDKDQEMHLYLYEKGRLFDRHDPGYAPTLFVGNVEMTNLPNRPVQHPANCMVRDFVRPALSLLPGNIPEEPRRPTRQLVIGLTSRGRQELMFYHSGERAPRGQRRVGSREITVEELESLGLKHAAERLPVDLDLKRWYTLESIAPDGGFVFSVPTDPAMSCDINLPSESLYPAKAGEVFRNRVKFLREDERSRLRVVIREARPHRKYVYRCSYREA